ncbi:hypothetical protein LBMAG27_06280 [Bacteroidota bacterium]|nr:hypothetical protein LBMAG27_06280 [Bacteroidota bacterium]
MNATYLFAQSSDSSGNNISNPAGTSDSSKLDGFQEVLPQFPGGEAAMLKFLADSIRYPKVAMKKNIQGKVVVRFVISETGELRDIEILRGLPGGLSEEVIRVVKLMPKWIPGSQLGKNVPVQYNLPVTFSIK